MEFLLDIPKNPHVKDIVQNFWQVDRHYPHILNETIVPKGSIEIIFNLFPSVPIASKIGAKHYTIPRCFISGNNTVPIELTIPTRQVFFGLCVNATSLTKIFGIDADVFANQCVDLTLVDPTINSLWNRLGEGSTFQGRIAACSAWLVKRTRPGTKHEKLFDEVLAGSLTNATPAQLSDKLCYSPRHLSRKLRQLTGMNLEQTILYKKYVHSLTLIHQSQMQLTEIAYASNFSDQSHFSKTFKYFAQRGPGEYRNLKSNVPGHIFQFVR